MAITLSAPSEFASGRAIAQAVSRRLSTAAARVRSQVRPRGICGGQSGAGAGYLRALRFPLPILIPLTTPHSSSIIRGWYNRPNVGRRTKWTHSVSPHPKKLKSFWLVFEKCPVQISTGTPTILTAHPRGFLRQQFKLGSDRFLPHTFQFIINYHLETNKIYMWFPIYRVLKKGYRVKRANNFQSIYVKKTMHAEILAMFVWSLQQMLCVVPKHLNTTFSSSSHKGGHFVENSWFHSNLPTCSLY
jgi:hypothetical protein